VGEIVHHDHTPRLAADLLAAADSRETLQAGGDGRGGKTKFVRGGDDRHQVGQVVPAGQAGGERPEGALVMQDAETGPVALPPDFGIAPLSALAVALDATGRLGKEALDGAVSVAGEQQGPGRDPGQQGGRQ